MMGGMSDNPKPSFATVFRIVWFVWLSLFIITVVVFCTALVCYSVWQYVYAPIFMY